MTNDKEKKHGFSKPNTVPTPDEFFDIALRECTGAEIKILAVVIDKTYRFNKVWDWISLSQFQKMTNLSRQGIINSLNSLEHKGWILSSYQCRKCGYVQEEKFSICENCQTKFPPARLTTAMIKDVMSNHLTSIFGKPPKKAKPFDSKLNLPHAEKSSQLSRLPQSTDLTTPQNIRKVNDSNKNDIDLTKEGSQLSRHTGNQETINSKSSSSSTVSNVHKGPSSKNQNPKDDDKTKKKQNDEPNNQNQPDMPFGGPKDDKKLTSEEKIEQCDSGEQCSKSSAPHEARADQSEMLWIWDEWYRLNYDLDPKMSPPLTTPASEYPILKQIFTDYDKSTIKKGFKKAFEDGKPKQKLKYLLKCCETSQQESDTQSQIDPAIAAAKLRRRSKYE